MLTRNKLLKTIIDIISSVIIISEPLLKQIGQPNQIIVWNKDVIAANKWKMPVKWPTFIQVKIQKSISQLRADFLVTTIKIMPFPLAWSAYEFGDST